MSEAMLSLKLDIQEAYPPADVQDVDAGGVRVRLLHWKPTPENEAKALRRAGETTRRRDRGEQVRPVLFAAGWGKALAANEQVLRTIVDDGRPLHAYDLPDDPDVPIPETYADKLREFGPFPQEEVMQALILIRALEKIPHGPADVVAHSRGFCHAAIAALLEPGLIRNIVGYGPPGLIGQDTVVGLAKRALWDQPKAERSEGHWGIGQSSVESEKTVPPREKKTQENDIFEVATPTAEEQKVIEAIDSHAARVMAKYVLKQPMRSLKEVFGLANVRLDRALPELCKSGVGVGLMVGADDKLFPAERMYPNLYRHDDEDVRRALKDAGVIITIVPGGHDAIVQRKVYARIAVGMTGLLEREKDERRKNRKNTPKEAPDAGVSE